MTLRDRAYPGPVPLDEENKDQLKGRELDVETLLHATLNRHVVEITAPSGTGKSSLIRAGLRPALIKRGLTPVILRSWADVSGDDANSYYLAAVRRAFVDTGLHREWTGDMSLDLDALEADYGSNLVVVFDQLEELLRLDPVLGQRFLKAAARAAHELPFRQIFSLRSEHKEDLNIFEENVSRSLWTYRTVGPIPLETEPKIIDEPPKVAGWRLSDGATQAILSVWRSARDSGPQIGLLHLQAMLWVIERQTEFRRKNVIDANRSASDKEPKPVFGAADLAKHSTFMADLLTCFDQLNQHGAGLTEPSYRVAAKALQLYAQLCISDLENAHNDPRTGRETRFAIAQVVGELSSAGYKVSRDTVDLFFQAFDDIEDLRWNHGVVSQLLAAVGGWSLRNDSTKTPTVEDLLAIAAEQGIDEHKIGSSREMLSGRLADMGVLKALAELIVIFERAIDWLKRASIVRVTKDLQGRRLCSLVHDGYGKALNEWAKETLRNPERFFEAPIGKSGGLVLAKMTVGRESVQDIHGLRWPGCLIPATTFRCVRFVGCIFRGLIFNSCIFEDVIFDQCDMPGVLFLDCTIQGRSGCLIESSNTRTLTLKGVSITGGGLTIRKTQEDGLFLDGVSGGPWDVQKSQFRHLSVVGAESGVGPGFITECSLSHVYIAGESKATTIRASSMRYLDSSPGMLKLVDDTTLDNALAL